MAIEATENTNRQYIGMVGGLKLEKFQRSHLIVGHSCGDELTICKHKTWVQGQGPFTVMSGMLSIQCSEFAINETFRTEIVCLANGDVRGCFTVIDKDTANKVLELIEELEA